MKQRHLLLVLLLCALACDSANPVAPTGTVLSANANPTQIALNGSSTITVTGFKPDGNPLNPGTQINVTTDLGNLVDPETGAPVTLIRSAEGGQAVARLVGDGRTGPATVTATLVTGGEASATATVQIGQDTSSQPTLIISANPTTIDIGEVSTITVIARAADGTPLTTPQRVRFTATLGVLNPSEKETDENGEAVVSLEAVDSEAAQIQAGMAEIQAILGTAEPASVSVTIRDSVDTISLQATPPEVKRAFAENQVISLVSIARNAQDQPLSGVTVNFSSPFGSLGSAGGAVLTNNQGQAVDTLTFTSQQAADIPDTTGSFTVRVEAGDPNDPSTTATATITVVGDPA